MEAFLAIQALCGGENSDSESIRSEISETFGALTFQRRPGSGRRKKQAPWRSPWSAGVSTDFASESLPNDHVQSRLGPKADPGLPSPVTSTAVAAEPAPANTPNVSTPSNVNRKKTKQDLAGPCCHCSATSSPQWRKGPKGKPILCNACGIRFLRTRTLGKSVPKKRRPPVITSGADISSSTQPKRVKAEEPSAEEDDMELAADEVLIAEETLVATDESIEEAHSGSVYTTSLGLAGLSDAAAAAAALGHHFEHTQQHSTAVLPTSRLAINSRAVEAAQAELAYAEAEEYQQYHCNAEEQYMEQYAEQIAEHYTSSTAAAGYHPAAGLFPEYGWPVTSLHPMGPHAAAAAAAAHGQMLHDPAALLAAAAAAARTAGTSSSTSASTYGVNTPVSTGIHQPLAAGSRLLLGGSSSSSGGGSRLSHNPSLALALAMHQQQHYSNSIATQQQQQQHPNSPMRFALLSHSGVTGSPVSHSSAFHPHLRAEYSGFSLASGSPPASPLTLGAAAGSGNLQHMPLSSKSSAGISSGTSMQQQQQPNGLHGPSPLSVMATAADMSHALADAAYAVASAQQHVDTSLSAAGAAHPVADLAAYLPGNASAGPADAPAAAAAAATLATSSFSLASQGDMLQLMRQVASALGGVGPTWDLLQSLQNSSTTGAAAGTAGMGLSNNIGITRQQL